ncbi:MAG: amidohydrolase family protein [Gemmatimonadetes bacterium]|nr:amidohydrolase family protein [Gemmatimonadota bacterium]
MAASGEAVGWEGRGPSVRAAGACRNGRRPRLSASALPVGAPSATDPVPPAFRAMRTFPVLSALLAAAAALPLHAQTTAFTGAVVWDGTASPAVHGATLLVRDGRVVSVGTQPPPAGVPVVSLAGKHVMPGLVDVHVHVTGRWAPQDVTDPRRRVEEELLLFARYGVTTVNSLGDEPAEAFAARDAQGTPGLARARLAVAGPVITSATEAEARAAVAANARPGVDWMKLRYDDNLGTVAKMPWEAVHGVVDEGHRRGYRVATHLFYLEDAKRLLREGSDMVAHSIRDADVDAEVIALLRERRVCYVPTLTRELSTFAYAEEPEFFRDPFFLRWSDAAEVAQLSAPEARKAVADSPAAARYRVGLGQAQRNLKALVDAGVLVGMGTDVGPAGRFPGYFEHVELALMAGSGLTPAEVLRTATDGAAACLGREDVGTLQPGRWADFLVLDADPLQDVMNTRRLAAVYVAGNLVR